MALKSLTISESSGSRMAASRPAVMHAARNARLRRRRSGSPKEKLLSPQIIPISGYLALRAWMVPTTSRPARVLVATGRTTGSILILSGARPASRSRSTT